MSEKKKLISIIICDGKNTENALEQSRYYSDNGADELLIFDKSKNDEEHENVIGTIKEIVRKADIPVIAGGNVKRLEDIKKYLYTGAKAAYLDVSAANNTALIKEAADRFGSEKIYAYLPESSYVNDIEEYIKLGASVILHASTDLKTAGIKNNSINIYICNSDEKTISEYLKCNNAAGAAFTDDDRIINYMDLKQSLKAGGIDVDTFESAISWSEFKLNSDGMIPVIVQDYKTLEVLMLAYMNEEAFERTLKNGKMTYYSRSRKTLWLKGETSGHFQYVKSLTLDCDNDTILAKVAQVGAACHTGARSCFFNELVKKEYAETNPLKVFEDVYNVILDRRENPKEGSYTNYLFDKGIDKILKKVGEEATEIVIAAKNPDPEEIKYEISDFLYHAMVLMAVKGVTWEDITRELANR